MTALNEVHNATAQEEEEEEEEEEDNEDVLLKASLAQAICHVALHSSSSFAKGAEASSDCRHTLSQTWCRDAARWKQCLKTHPRPTVTVGFPSSWSRMLGSGHGREDRG